MEMNIGQKKKSEREREGERESDKLQFAMELITPDARHPVNMYEDTSAIGSSTDVRVIHRPQQWGNMNGNNITQLVDVD